MSATALPPLVLIELLADRNRKPAALRLQFGEGSPSDPPPAGLSAFIEHPDFRSLTSRFPCVVLGDRVSPALAAIVQASGCQLVATDSVHRGDDSPGADLPSGARWRAGDWYLAAPAKPSANQAASRTLALQLVQLVSADADTHEIEAVLRRDPTLSYHLLRLVNSLGMGLSRQITSFSQAILILGRAQLRRWLNLMLFSARSGDDRSAMLLARVAVRARLMETLAKAGGQDKAGQESAFMAGMFSLLGILFGLPLEEVLRPLKISAALQAGVLRREGDIGRLLQAAEAAERGDLTALAATLDAVPLPHAEFNLLNLQAHAWMLGVIHESGGDQRG